MALPKSIVVHGFIAGSDGRKMSEPKRSLSPVSALSNFCCVQATFGDDVRFSEAHGCLRYCPGNDSLRLMHNADLCDNLGNLVNRAVSLCGGSVPKAGKKGLVSNPFNLKDLKTGVREAFEAYRLSEAADLTVRATGQTNKAGIPGAVEEESMGFMVAVDCRLGALEDEGLDAEKQELRAACMRKLLEADFSPIGDLSDDFNNLTEGKEAPPTSNIETVDVEAATEKKIQDKKAAAKAWLPEFVSAKNYWAERFALTQGEAKEGKSKEKKPKVEIKDISIASYAEKCDVLQLMPIIHISAFDGLGPRARA
eukprot:Skav228305  [mRNA]  locus=scaffold4453:21561:30015:+ [translate_table: standard]